MSWARRGLFLTLLVLAAAPLWAVRANQRESSESQDARREMPRVDLTSQPHRRGNAQDLPASSDVDERERGPNDERAAVAVSLSSHGERVPDQYVVHVTGRDFRWHFELEGDGQPSSGSRLAASSLELPAGVPIRWKVTSDDYIYWLRVPELGVNVMAVPDLTFEAHTPDPQPMGVDLLVDPLCGFRFYHDEWMGRIELRAGANQ